MATRWARLLAPYPITHSLSSQAPTPIADPEACPPAASPMALQLWLLPTLSVSSSAHCSRTLDDDQPTPSSCSCRGAERSSGRPLPPCDDGALAGLAPRCMCPWAVRRSPARRSGTALAANPRPLHWHPARNIVPCCCIYVCTYVRLPCTMPATHGHTSNAPWRLLCALVAITCCITYRTARPAPSQSPSEPVVSCWTLAHVISHA